MNVVYFVLHWLTTPTAYPYVIAVGISLAVAVSEIVSVFERDPVRALRTAGAFMLLVLNGIFVVVLLALVRYLKPDSNPLWTAVGVGIGLPVLLRTNFNLIKPLDGSASKGVGISFEEIYGRLQGFCRRRTDVSLAAQRIRTVDEAIKIVELSGLETRLRLLLEGGLLTIGEESQGYVDKIIDHPDYKDDRKSMLLTFAILNFGGDRMLENMVKEAKKGSQARANLSARASATKSAEKSLNSTKTKDAAAPVT